MRNKAKLIKKINEVCDCKNKYCLLKEIILCSHQDPRFLVQLKCIEMFKWEKSEEKQKDIGWDEAHVEWVSEGYAKRFAELYEEEIDPETLYKKIKNSFK